MFTNQCEPNKSDFPTKKGPAFSQSIPEPEKPEGYLNEIPEDNSIVFTSVTHKPSNGSQGNSNPCLPVILENMPAQLHSVKNWVLWKFETRKGSDKKAKVPYTVNGYHASTNKPSTWSSFERVSDVLRKTDKYSGVGLVLKTQIDGHDIVGIDVDYPYDSEIANEFRSRFSDTYTEKSPSGRLRIFCTGVIPRSGKGNNDQKVEVFNHTSSKYMTITGHRLNQRNITLQQDALNWLFKRFFSNNVDNDQLQITTQSKANHAVDSIASTTDSSQKQRSEYSGGSQSTQPVQSLPNENDSQWVKWSDKKVIRTIQRSKVGVDFNILFEGGSIKGNESQDDMKLAGMIGFYAGSAIGSGEDQVFRIVGQSKRANVLSGKWQRVGMDVSKKVIANARVVYTPTLKVTFKPVDDAKLKRDVKKLATIDCNVTDVIAEIQAKHPNVANDQIEILVNRQIKTLQSASLKSRLDKANKTKVTNTLDLSGMTVHESNSRYTSLPIQESGTMIVKAAMGTGKTYFLESAIQKYTAKNLSCAYICHRISLANSASKRLKLDFYQDEVDLTQGVSIVVNSIPTYSGFLGTPDVVIIDEGDQVLRHITGSACSNGSEVLRTLQEWVSKAKICIIMSADIDELTINFVKDCRPGKIDFYLNCFKPRDKQEMIVCESISDIYCLIENNVNAGVGCTVIATNSKEESQKVYQYLKSRCENARGFMLNSSNSENEDTLNLIKDIDNRINNLDYLIFSPSIGSGVSIETSNISGVFGIFNSKAGGTPSDAWQQIGRVRKLDVPTYVYIDRTINNSLPITEDEIFDVAIKKLNAVTFEIEKGNQSHWTKSGIVDSVRGYKATEFDGLCVSVIRSTNILNRDFFGNFLLQGREKGIVFKEVSDELKPAPEKKSLAKDARKDASQSVKMEKQEKILNSSDLTTTEVRDLIESSNNGSKISQDEQVSIDKYFIAKEFGLLDNPNVDTQSPDYIQTLRTCVELDCDGKGRTILKRIKAINQPITTTGDDDVSDLTRYIENHNLLSKSATKRYKLVDREMIIRLFEVTGIRLTENGLEHSGDGPKYYCATDKDVTEFVSWCKDNGIVPKKSQKSNAQIIGELLRGLELGTSTKEHVIGNGKRYKVYWVKLFDKNNQPAYKFNQFLTSKIATQKNGLSDKNLVEKPTTENCPHPPIQIYTGVGVGGAGNIEPLSMPVDEIFLPQNSQVFLGCGKHSDVIVDDLDKCYTRKNAQTSTTVDDSCYNPKIESETIENHNKQHKADMPKNLWRGFDSDDEFWYKRTKGMLYAQRVKLAHEYDAEWERVNTENANDISNHARRIANSWLIEVTEKKAA
jgi:primase-polymerase (primpol)-like protein